MKEFQRFHPVVNFIYFVFVIGFSCFFMHPLCILISFLCAVSYLVMLKGIKKVKKTLVYVLGIVLVTALINPLFNHEGVTIITYFKSGNPFTLESLLYGFSAGGMLSAVILWFLCYSEVFTSDKFIYLFGKSIPKISLVFSMTLGFVPRFLSQLKKVINAQKLIGKDLSKGNMITRIKNALTVLSALTTWSLENSIDTADSMKSKGYGLTGRTAFSIYKFDKRDIIILMLISFLGIAVLVGAITGKMYFNYFPIVKMSDISLSEVICFVFYALLCGMPLIIEIREAIRWNALISKI